MDSALDVTLSILDCMYVHIINSWTNIYEANNKPFYLDTYHEGDLESNFTVKRKLKWFDHTIPDLLFKE